MDVGVQSEESDEDQDIETADVNDIHQGILAYYHTVGSISQAITGSESSDNENAGPTGVCISDPSIYITNDTS